MSQETLNSYLNIKSGVGALEIRRKCRDCIDRKNGDKKTTVIVTVTY